MRKIGYGATFSLSWYLFSLLIWMTLPERIVSCPLHCSQNGVCSGPGPDGYCICHPGYTGDGCEIRMCPKGDDPLTTNQKPRQIKFGFDALSGDLNGYLSFTFLGEDILLDANANSLTDEKCTRLFQSLPNVEQVVCARTSDVTEANGANYSVTFEKFPTFPYENNLYYHDGNPPLTAFNCDTSKVEGADGLLSCYVEDMSYPDLSFEEEDDVVEGWQVREYTECSNHGICNRDTGKCHCEPGFHGPSCDDITDDQDVEYLHADGPFYTGNVLHLSSNREKSDQFHILRANVRDSNLFEVIGNGEVVVNEGPFIVEKGGTFVDNGGLVIGNGGIVVQEDGIDVISSSKGGVAVFEATSDEFEGAVLQLQASGLLPKNYSFVRGIDHNGKKSFDIENSGHLHIYDGGLTIESGSIDLKHGKAHFQEGVDMRGGLNVNGNIHIVETQESKERSLAPILVQGKSLSKVESRSEYLFQAQVDDVDVVTIDRGGHMKVSSGGLEIGSGGLSVEMGGGVIKSGGLQVDGGITLKSGALKLKESKLNLEESDLQISSTKIGEATLQVSNTNEKFVSNVLELRSAVSHNDASFIKGFNGNLDEVFDITSNGDISTNGGFTCASDSSLEGLSINSWAAIGKATRKGFSKVTIPSDVSYFEIHDNDDGKEIDVTLPAVNESKLGQILLIENRGSQATVGDIEVPANQLRFYLNNGENWAELSVSKATMTDLNGVKSIEAANDLDFGKHALITENLFVKSAGKGDLVGSIAFFAEDGLLLASRDISYSTDGIISINRLNVTEITSAIDFRGNTLKNAVLESPIISDLESLRISNKLILNKRNTKDGVLILGEDGEITDESLQNLLLQGSVKIPDLKVPGKLEAENLRTDTLQSTSMQVDLLRAEAFEQGDIECDGTILKNVQILGGKMDKIETIETNSLIADKVVLRNEEEVTEESFVDSRLRFLAASKDGQVTSLGKEMMSFDPSSGEFFVDKLSVNNLIDNNAVLSISNQHMTNISITEGNLDVDYVRSVNLEVSEGMNVGGDMFVGGSVVVAGSVMGSGPFLDTSDSRLKEHISKLSQEDSLKKVLSMRPVKYNFTKKAQVERGAPTSEQIGFIAQEVEELAPEIVSEQDGIKAIAYSHTTPLLVGAIQELYNELSDLKEEVRKLTMENERLNQERKNRRQIRKQKKKAKRLRKTEYQEGKM